MKYVEILCNIQKELIKKKDDAIFENEVATMQDGSKASSGNSRQEKAKPSLRSRLRMRPINESASKEDLLKIINKELCEMCTEDSVMLAIYNEQLKVLLKTNCDDNNEEIISSIEDKIRTIVSKHINILLKDDEDDKEEFKGIDFEVKTASIVDFYFDGMRNAERYGIDFKCFEKNLNSTVTNFDYRGLFGGRIDECIYEYNIPKKLSKEEFYEEFKEQILNKSFKEEIDRIYLLKKDVKVNINPVHYEFTEYDEAKRLESAKALATALYSVGRITSNKFVKFNVDINNNYISNDLMYMLLKNLKNSFILIDFDVDRNKSSWHRNEYYGITSVRIDELADNILSLKDEIQFAIYVDKYQDKVRSGIVDCLKALNIMTFDDKLNPESVMDYMKELAKKKNIEIDQRLVSAVEMSKDNMTLKDAEDIFDNYKDEKIKTTYFPEYRDYFEGRGNVNFVDPYDTLMSMPGLKNVKKVLNEIIAFHKLDSYKKDHFMEFKDKDTIKGLKYNGNSLSNHMIFMGNPGTCKTTVAKMIAKIFKSRGIIKNDRTEFYGIEGRCYHIENAFKYAYGGVLFIDEAYSLNSDTITELVALMENHRNDVMVILAGYTESMKKFLHRNEGLTSRFNYLVEFEDYTEEELWEILKYQAKEQNQILDDSVKEKVMPIFESSQANKEMGNGRLVRKMLQMATKNQASRLANIDLDNGDIDLTTLSKLTKEDFDIDYKELTGTKAPKVKGNADPEIELDRMVGLKKIKSMVNKCVSAGYMNKARRDTFGEDNKEFVSSPMHLAFFGNPGTAKSTVARLFARILKKKGIIKKENIVEVGRKDLVGLYVGHTAPQVASVFERAKGGVLFIDEAYSLVDDRRGSFADEAINEIIAQMENLRDEVIVIFAGYTDKMKEFFSLNEGFRSRISYILEFEDYSSEELMKIFEKMIDDEKYIVSDEIKNYVKDIFDKKSSDKDFGNGRFVRKVFEDAKLNMDLRLANLKKDKYSKEELKTFLRSDFENIEDDKVLDKEEKTIGFAA